MALLPPLEKRILQSRESDADTEMSSSSLSGEDALEYNMSEDLEDSPAVISPPPSSKPEKANKYKNSLAKNGSCAIKPHTTNQPRFLFQRADWTVFSQLADITETTVSTADISESVQYIANAITNASNSSIPKTLPRLRKFRKPWWNAACRDSRRENILWNRFRRYPTTENLVAFKHAKGLARRIRRRSQRESWINFISSIASSTSSKQL
ncbi:hypothetical protein AVEN_50818-1 [Araneus ventricosus]|uniref:Uncharacterized protein n=1 Tax=Araneus ventricosus TaxID=182803 RepID=A0A4Y2ITZ6_ARAVE|nr:hypothetical protein AVEN_50818-1 [Araneus ventricosus]